MKGPEFSRLVAVDTIGFTPIETCVEADLEERTALANRLRIPGILALSCRFALHRDSSEPGIIAEATLDARVVQTCVVSLDEFEADVREAFSVRFVPAGSETESLDLTKPDEIPYESAFIDLGEAAAEQLALALDPFPRKPDAIFAGESDPARTAFDALRSLRRRH